MPDRSSSGEVTVPPCLAANLQQACAGDFSRLPVAPSCTQGQFGRPVSRTFFPDCGGCRFWTVSEATSYPLLCSCRTHWSRHLVLVPQCQACWTLPKCEDVRRQESLETVVDVKWGRCFSASEQSQDLVAISAWSLDRSTDCNKAILSSTEVF